LYRGKPSKIHDSHLEFASRDPTNYCDEASYNPDTELCEHSYNEEGNGDFCELDGSRCKFDLVMCAIYKEKKDSIVKLPKNFEPPTLKTVDQVDLDKINPLYSEILCADPNNPKNTLQYHVVRNSLGQAVRLVPHEKLDTKWVPNYKLERWSRYNENGDYITKEFSPMESMIYKERIVKARGGRFGPIKRRIHERKCMKRYGVTAHGNT